MSGRCIAMWSGPRNISTAMMRSWENRSDTVVIDEPFYAHFLQHTGIDHPMREEVINAGERNWQTVVDTLVQPPAKGIFYQKHITTHWLDHFSTDWLDALDHVFLIRNPVFVAASYAIKRATLTASDLGYAQQSTLFDLITKRSGQRPLVIDSTRFLNNPGEQLRALCNSLGIGFDENMLQWRAGARATDGIWGQHWYDSVNQSTGFAPARSALPALDPAQQQVVDSCQPHYATLEQWAIK